MEQMLTSAQAVFALVVVLPGLVIGQTSTTAATKIQIMGRVVDVTGAPLPRTTVLLTVVGLEKPTATVLTDDAGTFVFPSVSPQSSELRFEEPGSKPRTMRLPGTAADIMDVGAVVMQIGEITEGPVTTSLGPNAQVKPTSGPERPGRQLPIKTTVCELVRNPERFSGKLVIVNGRIQIAFEQFELLVPACDGKKIDAIWLEYGKGPKRHPATWCCGDMVPRDNLTLVQNNDFRKFHGYITAQSKTRACYESQCNAYAVTATITGRLDSVKPERCRDGKSWCCENGFGHLGAFCGRIVIRSVSNVVAKPINPPGYEKK